MPVFRIGQLLAEADELKAVSARTRRLRQLQKLYCESAPPELAGASRVTNFRAGVLFIGAENAAVAAKLRQLTTTLLKRITESEPEVTGIRIGVQVRGRAPSVPLRRQKNALPADILKKLSALSRSVGDGDLSSALARMVEHQRRSKAERGKS